MLKTPPRLTGLGIALTVCAIGAGSANTIKAASAPEILHPDSIEFELELPAAPVVNFEFATPELTKQIALHLHQIG